MTSSGRGGTRSIELSGFLPVRTLRADVVAGPDRGRSHTAEIERLTVGTARGNDLVLTDRSVSRYHLELQRTADGVLVIDLGSTNGTRFQGARIERATVGPGTVLDLGATRLRLTDGDATAIELHGDDCLEELRGRSAVMRRLMARIVRVGASDASVLITGESGTGKELVARALHQRSERASGPFVTVDCGALVPTLAASELFGHESGAFTGATVARAGAFERATGGTLLLDEIGDLPSELQSHLLGVLERRTIRRVGGDRDVPVDVRVLCATHRDLRAAVNRGDFRLDLYYRIAVVALELPPLRDRLDDIPVLVDHFLTGRTAGRALRQPISPDELDRLRAHGWPGNVRELRNVVEATIATGDSMHPAAAVGSRSTPGFGVASAAPWLPPRAAPANAHELEPLTGGAVPMAGAQGDVSPAASSLSADGSDGHESWLDLPYAEARDHAMHRFQRRYVEHIIAKSGGNVAAAAREAGMDRSHLFQLLRRHGLR